MLVGLLRIMEGADKAILLLEIVKPLDTDDPLKAAKYIPYVVFAYISISEPVFIRLPPPKSSPFAEPLLLNLILLPIFISVVTFIEVFDVMLPPVIVLPVIVIALSVFDAIWSAVIVPV